MAKRGLKSTTDFLQNFHHSIMPSRRRGIHFQSTTLQKTW